MGIIGCEGASPPRRRIIRNYVTLRLNLAEHIVLRTIVICGIVYECYLWYSVAKGGELCLTSGDHREPEDSDVYIKTLPLARLSRARGRGKGKGRGCRFPRVPFSHPRLSIIRRLRRRHATHLLITLNIIRPLHEPYIIRPLHAPYIIRSLYESKLYVH